MSNTTRHKGASDSDLMILLPLAVIITGLGLFAASMA